MRMKEAQQAEAARREMDARRLAEEERRKAEEKRRSDDARRKLDAQMREDDAVSRTVVPYVTRRGTEEGYSGFSSEPHYHETTPGYSHETPRPAAPGEAPAVYPVVPSIVTQH